MQKALQIGTLLRLPEMTRENVEYLVSAGLETLQVARAGEDWMTGEAGAARTAADFRMLAEFGLKPVSLFMGMAPETSGDGFVPLEARTSRMVYACRQMLWAKANGILSITCHVGALSNAENYPGLVADFRQMLRFAADNGQEYLLETGPETVAFLKQFLADVGMPNLGINFDPANCLWYDHDDPAVLVEELWDRVRVVHCKDAVRPAAGEAHGHETVLGQGATNFVEIMKELLGRGYRGPLIIERELPYGPEQRKDVVDAIRLLQNLRAPFLEK